MAARERLDSDLGVRQWRVTPRVAARRVDVEPDAPSWWHGDEEASSSFLAAMGVSLP